MTLANFARRGQRLAIENSPAILTALGVAGVATTAVLTAKAALRASEAIKEDILASKPTDGSRYYRERKDDFKIAWKFFVPAATVGVGTAACIICANRIGTRRAAAMAAAYTLSEKAFVQYKDEVVEMLGEKKEQTVRDRVAHKQVTRNPPSGDMIVVGGEVIFHEAFTGRYFKSTMEDVKSAVNRLNHHMINNFSSDLNDFYDFVGLDRTDMGDRLGWNSDKLIELNFTTIMTDDQRPAISFGYKHPPQEGYFRTSM